MNLYFKLVHPNGYESAHVAFGIQDAIWFYKRSKKYHADYKMRLTTKKYLLKTGHNLENLMD